MRIIHFFIITFLSYGIIQACDYTVDLNDTWGDGWNGNTITITVNGAPVLTAITVATGNTYQDFFSANPGDVVAISYDNSGSFQSENEITITSDDLGVVVFTDGMGGVAPSGGSFTIAVDCGIAPPSNDEPCQAINLPMAGICNPLAGSVDGATASAVPNPTCGTYTTQGDVWFETTVGASGLLQIDLTDGGIDANMAIYDGTDCNTLNEIGCSVSNTFYSDIIAPGTQLWIRVWDENNSIGSFTICAIEPPPPPTNNDPCTAELLTVDTTCINTIGTTASAINSAVADPTCSWNYQGGDVWYTAIVPQSGFMHVNLTAGGLVDGGIAVYSGVDCNTLTEVACNESTWQMPAPVVITPADALQGQQVWIRIWEGDDDNPGSFEICLVDEPVLFVDPTTYTPEELVEDILITGCLQAMNVQYEGHPSAIAYFEGGEGTFGMASGLVLGSGSAVSLTGQGVDDVMGEETTQTDIESDLSTIAVESYEFAADDMHDEAILEFDFIPSSDTTLFDFVFASEEYPGFELSSYNDIFAFFVSGPGINGPYADNAINVAIIPGTTDAITISTVNGPVADGGNGFNSNFFAAYTNGAIPNFNVGGYTVPITAVMAGLTPCETYHIKFAIADAGDGTLSSYVFFEESSFSSGGDVAMSNVSNIGQVNDIYEGCENFYVFNRLDTSATALQDTVNILLNIGGTAIEGIDYTDIPDTMSILPGNLTDTLFYTAFFDNVNEGDEYIIFSLLNGCPCSLTSTDDTIWIRNNYFLNADISDPDLICYGDSSEITTIVNPNIDPLLITYAWSTFETTPNKMAIPQTTTDYTVTITNVCQLDEVLTTTIEVVPTIDPSIALTKDTACVGEPIYVSFVGTATPLALFNWTFTGGTPDLEDGIGPHAVSWTTTGNKTIDLHINDQGCLNDTSMQIYIKEYNNMALSTTSSDINCFSICDGVGSVQANNGISPFTYLWEDGQTEQSATGLCPGSYNVTVSDFYGCKDTTHVVVTSVNDLVYTYETDSATCNGYSDGAAYLNVSGGVPPYSYEWSNGIVEENNININANTYMVTISDANGCQKIENNIVIEEPTAVNASIYGDHYSNGGLWICIGETEHLQSSATGGYAPYTFVWNTTETSDNIYVTPQETTNYSTQATDVRGCVSPIQNITVNVYQTITFETQFTPSEICKGELVNVNIEANGGNGQYNYTITSGTNTDNVSEAFVIAPNETQEFVVSVTDNCSSPTNDFVQEIVVHQQPEISFIADIHAGCAPLEVRFTENSPEDDNTYVWEFSDGVSYSEMKLENNPTLNFKAPGVYTVYVKASNPFGCESELTKHNYITVFETPIAKFEVDQRTQSVIKPQIIFQNQSEMSTQYTWMFGDSDTSTAHSPVHTYPERVSDYQVEMIAKNRFGCSDTTVQKVKIVDEITFYPPTAFTPDGDGKNEVFGVHGNGITNENFNLVIYDRWGMEIYNTTEIDKPWDGKANDGSYVKPGSYKWIVRYTDTYKVPHEKTGNINVIR